MSVLLVYIQIHTICFDLNDKKKEIFILISFVFSLLFCSSLFYFVIQSTHIFLYLHPSENPTASLVSPVLDSNNYHSWTRSFVTTLNAKNKLEFILDSRPCSPKDDPTFVTWSRCNNMVVSWLVHSVFVLIRQSVIWMHVAFDV